MTVLFWRTYSLCTQTGKSKWGVLKQLKAWLPSQKSGKYMIFCLSCQQFLHGSLEMLQYQMLFEVEQEAHVHLNTCMGHSRLTGSLTATGYSSMSYLSEMIPLCSHSTSGWESRFRSQKRHCSTSGVNNPTRLSTWRCCFGGTPHQLQLRLIPK